MMQEPIQTAVAEPVETMPGSSGAGRFKRCNAGRRCLLRFAQARPWRTKLCDQPSGNQRCNEVRFVAEKPAERNACRLSVVLVERNFAVRVVRPAKRELYTA